jgi:hypothetical protein
MTQKAAQYHSLVYMRNIAARLDELQQETLTIFVCGPSERSNPLTKKRYDTVNALRADNHSAIIGEDEVPRLIKIDEEHGRKPKPFNNYERLLADECDLVIVFCASPGSIGETHEFLSAPNIAQKTLVYADEVHKSGYSAKGALTEHERLYGKVIYYKYPDDIEQCNLKTQIIDRVEDLKIAKAMQKVGFAKQ